LKWKTVSDLNIKRYVVEYSTDGLSWNMAGEVAALNQPGDLTYNYRHYIAGATRLFYRLRIEDNNGSISYSPIIDLNGKGSIKVFPTVITSRVIQVTSDEPIMRVNIIDNNGKIVMSKQTGGQQGYFTVPLPAISKGLYFVQLETKAGTETVKVMVQ
jgi:hypothetical protein